MTRCDRRLEPPVRYQPTRSGVALPVVRLQVKAGKGRFAVIHGFRIDTGADIAIGLAEPLRNWLRTVGLRPRRDAVEWGPAVSCEVYDISVLLDERWVGFDAFFPTGPKLDENLVGLPLLQWLPVCLRPADEVLHISGPA